MSQPPGPGNIPLPPEPQRKRSWVVKTFFIVAVGGSFIGITAIAIIFAHFSRGLPSIITIADYRPPIVTRIVGAGGKDEELLGEFFKQRRYVIPYEKIPDVVVRAFISAEDDRFFEHPGINIASMVRAAIADFRAGHAVQGGSTITQQVAKSLLLTPEKSFVRKIKEVILASRMESNLTKQQILYLYLNQIYLGHGAYGIQAASMTYFRKDVSSLDLAEAALLAGMPQAPGKYSPLLNPKKAKERQLYVLRRMLDNKYITQAQMNEAAAMPLRVFHDEDINTKYAAYLVEYIRKYLVEKYGDKAVYEGGLSVSVPATRELSLTAGKSLREGLSQVDKRIGYRGPVMHLRSNQEIEKYLTELRVGLVDRKLHYQMLQPDGTLDPIDSIRAAGFESDAQLLEEGEIYPAVVTSFDNKKKTAGVMLGAIRATLPLEKMLWARPVRDDKSPQAYREPPRLPSKVLSRGDVILVRYLGLENKEVVVGLEQTPLVQGALFSMEAQTGNVLAMQGGYEFGESEFNRAVQAMRQPGSSFKPIIYAAALEKGYTPTSIIVDSPIVYEDLSGKWKPGNFEEKFYGDTTFRQALIKSRNVPTIKIVQAIQVPYVIEYAKRLGMNAQFPMDLSISLGSASVSLLDLTRIYALFPRLGRKVTPIFITKIVDRDGRVLEEQKPQSLPLDQPTALPGPVIPPQLRVAAFPSPGPSSSLFPVYPLPNDPDQVLDPRVAYVMTHLMKEVVNYGTGHDAKALGRPAAGKTGTTNDFIDAWFMGFTPYVVSGVWVGFDNQKSLGRGETGARAALPIWLSFMREAVKLYPDQDFQIPPGVVFASINPTSGKLAPPNSSSAIKEAFIEGTQPTESSEKNDSGSDNQGDFFKEDTE